MGKSVDFYFDVGSPAAYLAWTQLPALCLEAGATLKYRPMLLGGVFQATGNRAPISVPLKGSYLFDDLARFARRYGVPFSLNPHFPVNTITLMRIAAGLEMRADARVVVYLGAVFEALWVNGMNMADPATAADVLQAAGLDAAELMALAADPQVKDRLRLQTEAAVARGVFGAPSMLVDGILYWGQDRLDFVREALSA
ncbi:2-hydroxychromene-2-carboxylate isomerase [Polaromonas sp.]|uniref:2-hydroxychromene-2-carboxylate isomerase n=1 Tax=Polaromonas sp. TaxID=1869339 RepID=UPI0013BA5B60|nr:2-hydroxychromene-2-carboxylate isomerase [Polaromonas sp.]NDP63277.1 2-hydroxychromene-2-carboxylate isomerase [Polaromonas sp.]